MLLRFENQNLADFSANTAITPELTKQTPNHRLFDNKNLTALNLNDLAPKIIMADFFLANPKPQKQTFHAILIKIFGNFYRVQQTPNKRSK